MIFQGVTPQDTLYCRYLRAQELLAEMGHRVELIEDELYKQLHDVENADTDLARTLRPTVEILQADSQRIIQEALDGEILDLYGDPVDIEGLGKLVAAPEPAGTA